MASSFLKKQANKRAKRIQKAFGKGVYGSTPYIDRVTEYEQTRRDAEEEWRQRQNAKLQAERNAEIADWIKGTSPLELEEERQRQRIEMRPQYEAEQNRNISEYIKSLSPLEMEKEEQQRRIEEQNRKKTATVTPNWRRDAERAGLSTGRATGQYANAPDKEAAYLYANGVRPKEEGQNRLTPQAEFMYEYVTRKNNRNKEEGFKAPEAPAQRMSADWEAEYQRRARGEGPGTALTPYAQYMANYQAQREKDAAQAREKAESGWPSVGYTAAGMVTNAIEGVGQPFVNMAKGVEGFGDMLYRNTGSEWFKPEEPGARLSDVMQSSGFGEFAQEMKDKVGPLGQRLIDTAGAATSMLSSYAIFGGLANTMGGPLNATAKLANLGGNKVVSTLGRVGARIGTEILSNPGNFGVSLGSGLSGFSDAYADGASFAGALANGVLKGLTEYYSNKLFSGTPYEDTAEKGYVTRLIEAIANDLGGSKVLQAINTTTGGQAMNWILDKAGEGMEEVVTGFAEPLIDRLTYNPEADLATAAELTDEFIGGVLLSLLMSGGEAMLEKLENPEKMTEREVVNRLKKLGISQEDAKKYAPDLAEAMTALLQDTKMQRADYAEKSVGDPEIAAKAGENPSLQRYADVYNRSEARQELQRNPGSVSEAAYLTDNEAGSYFYIWNNQGAQAADAYYDLYLKPSLDARRTMAMQEYAAQAAREEQEQRLRQQYEQQNRQNVPQEKPTIPSQETVSARQADPLGFAMNKATSGETVTKQDARAIIENPQALQALRDSGVLTGKVTNDSEGRGKVVDAVNALAEQLDREQREAERPARPVPSGMQQNTETRTETRTETSPEPAQAGPPLPSRMTQEQESRAETPAAQESAQGASEAAQATPTERKRPSAKQQSLAQQRQRQTETQAENLRERGFTTAGEDTVAHVRSEDTWDAEEKAVAAALREQGIEPTFVTGLLKNAEGKRTTAILEGNRLAIQADNRSQTVQSIAEKALGKTLNVDPAAFGSAAEAAITARTGTKSKPAKTVSQRAQATLDSARQYGVSDEDANTAARLADVLGKDIRFYSKPGSDSGWENGYTEDGVIYVNAAAKARTVTWVIGHELTHNTEHARIYQALQKLAKQYYGSQWQNRIDSRVAAGERMAKAKGNDGYRLSPEAAAQELTADYFAEKVLTDEATIRQIVKNDAPTARRIVSYLKNLLQKLKGKEPTIERAIDLYSRALKQAAQEAQEKGRKNSAEERVGIHVDEATESANAMQYSFETWESSDYVTDRRAAAEDLAKKLGVSYRKALKFIDDVNSIAKIIAEDQARLDYEASPGRTSFVGNTEYGGSIDFSTICKKRRLYTGTIEAIQKAMPNQALTVEEMLRIRRMMKDRGYEVSCGLCYVEGSRTKMGEFSSEFIELYKKHNPDAEWIPNMVDVNTPDGVEAMRQEHPEAYKAYEYFWNHYGTLQKGDKNLFASQQKPKLYQTATAYNGEILRKFKNSKTVEKKNTAGGLRLQSFSDFEIIHLIDNMQVIMDMSRVGLAGQAYTKVPDFAWALGNTGLKINLSLIAKGVDENGNIVLDEVEGMKRADAEALRDAYSKNVGTILVTFTDEQLKAAMADPFIDFIIPFHKSQWSQAVYDAIGLPEGTKSYEDQQNESYLQPVYNESGKAKSPKNFWPNDYWDFSKTGKENAETYLKMCAEDNRRPKFYKLLVDNGDGSYSLQPDGSTDGYWKLLSDYKMYDNAGKGSPQTPVQPKFNMEQAERMLNEYTGGHQSFPVAKDVVTDFLQGKGRLTLPKTEKAEKQTGGLTLPSRQQAAEGKQKTESRLELPSRKQYSAEDRQYLEEAGEKDTKTQTFEYMKPFAEQLQDFMDKKNRGETFGKDALLIGTTPQVFQDIGLISLPVAINQSHVKYVTDQNYAGKEEFKAGHTFDIDEFAKLPEKLADPVAIIADQSKQDLVVYVEMKNESGSPTIVPFRVDTKTKLGGRSVDVQLAKSVYGGEDADSILAAAIGKDSKDSIRVYYVNKSKIPPKISAAVREYGRTVPDGIIHTINEPGAPVKGQKKSKLETSQFKNWFKGSKVVDSEGNPKIVYHQTAARFWTFNTDNPVAAKNDSETPNGIFFKDNDHDIGIGGDRQMAVYLAMRKPLQFKNREAANKWYQKHIDGYAQLQDKMKAALGPFDAELNEIENEMFAEGTTDEQYEELNKKWDAKLDQMREVEDKYRGQLRELLNDYFLKNDSGFDGIILDYDGHRYVDGKRENVKTYIVFKNTQIKSATDNIGLYDPKNPDIRYSAEDSEYERELGSRSLLSTPALKKLGVKVSGSVGQYGKTESLLAKDKAAKSLQREARKAEKRLRATDAEKEFANGIAAGIYSEEDIPKRMNKDTVMELADYYFAENSANLETLHQLRSDINQGLRDEAQELLEDADIKPQSMLLLNERTPERSFRAMFGDRAEEITKWMLDPVRENEAEKIRWYNKQMDAVRKFKDSKGKTRELTRAESALTMRVMEGRAAADMVAAMETRAAIENAAQNIRNGEDPGDAAMEFSLSAGERDLAEKYAGWLSVQEELKTADSTIVEAAAEKYAQIFDDYYDAINDFLAAHGYEPIGYIKGYAPHMQPEENQSLLQKAFASLGINEEVSQLPASIAGMTTFFKPNKRWNPYFLQRTGDTAEYDIIKAYQSYVDYMADILYHTDDVMRIRQTANWIRKTYAPEEIRANLDWAQEMRNASAEEKQRLLRDAGEIGQNTVLSPVDTAKAMQDYIDKLYQQIADSSKNSNLVMWLDNYANILAGKQSFADRGWEYSTGRKSLNWANRLNNVFQKANVAGNLSSILNQTAQLPMIYAELGERDFLGAMADIVSGKTKSWAQDSDFLAAKEGKDLLYTDNADKFISALFAPAGFTDNLVSTIAVRGAFKKAIREGMSYSEAMAAADKFGQAVMGSRAKGSRPLAYESKGFFSKMVHMFQIEAVNSWDHMVSDLPYEIRQIAKTDGKDKAARALAALVIRALLGAFVLNRLTDELYGGTPAPFDVLGLAANFVASGQGLSTNQYIRTIIDNTLEKMGAERIFETEKKTKEDFDLDAAAEELIYNVMNDIPLIRNAAGVMGLGDQTVPLPGAGGEFKNLATTAKALLKDGREEGEVANLIKAAILAGLQFVPGGRQLSKTAQGAEALIRGGSYSGYKNPKLQYPLEGAADTAKALLFGKNATGAAQDYWAAGGKALTEKQTALYQSMVDEGMSRREAFETITGHRTEGTLDDYVKWTESRSRDAGIGEDLYLRFRADTKDITGDPDGKGGTISGSKKQKIVDYIDSLEDLAPDQKTAMLLDYNSTYSLKDLPWLEGAPAEPQETKPAAEPGSPVAAEPNKPAPTEPEKVTKMRGTLTELGLQDSKVDALAPVLGGDGSNTSKWRAVADQNLGKDQQDAVLKSIMTDAMYRNWSIVSGENISLDSYVKGREAYVDMDDSGTDQNGEWTAALEKVDFDKDAGRNNYIKGVLWQIYTGSSSTKNNPFDKAGGQAVLDAKSKGGGKGSGSYAPARLKIQKQPWEVRPSSGLRITARPQQEAARPSGLRITARAK